MNRLNGLIIILILMGLFSLGCEQEKSDGLFDPNDTYKPDPVITAIDPANSALAGIVEITISGQNFSPIKENNFVYFGKTRAQVLAASATQLKVLSPNIVVDSTSIKVSVIGAISFSNLMPYQLVRGVGEYGGFGDFDDPFVLECDRNENLYVALSGKKVVKILPDETRSDYGTTTFSLYSSMKFGPDGYLYIARVIKALYRIPPGGGAAVKWISTPGQVYDFDFLANGMMYAGGKGDSLYLIRPDGSALGVAGYPNTYVKAVRIYNGYVYVGGKDNTANRQFIWRNQILPDNRVTTKELYFDWGANIDLNSEILSMTFSQNGDLYVGTDSLAASAMYVVHPDQTFEPQYPTVLTSASHSFYSLSWGTESFLYAARRSGNMKLTRVLKINMLKSGAPYFGRP